MEWRSRGIFSCLDCSGRFIPTNHRSGGAALGFALLAKGPIAYLAPFLFLGGYSLARRGLSQPTWKRIAGVFAVSAIVGFPWFLWTARETGGESLTTFLLRENWNRFLHPMEGHGGAILYFLVILAFGFFPWSGLLVVVKKSAFRREPARWGLFAWGCGVLAFFSLSATKLPHYLLPALPAFALLLADTFDADSRNEIRVFAWATALSGLLLFLGVLFAARQWDLLGIAGNVLWPFAVVATLSLPFPSFPPVSERAVLSFRWGSSYRRPSLSGFRVPSTRLAVCRSWERRRSSSGKPLSLSGD